MLNKLHIAVTVVLAVVAIAAAQAQTVLTGHTYHNPNILKEELESKVKEVLDSIPQKRAQAIAKAEEKKGGKLTADELEQIDKEIAKAKELSTAMVKGMRTAVTIDFKTADKCVMKMDASVDETVLKAAGIGWAKRKMIKTMMALSPSSQKCKYFLQGKHVIIDDGEDKDTLTLSNDGMRLTAKNMDMTFVLTRTK